MKKWRPAPERWVAAFTAASAGLGEPRKMFGYPCVFVNGNMFAGLHEAGMVVRLPEKERTAFLLLDGARPFEPMPGRVMREYVVVPDALAGEPAAVTAWLRKAFRHAASLPAKTPRRRAVAAARRARH